MTTSISNVIQAASSAEWTKEPIALITLFRGTETIKVPESAVPALVGSGWAPLFDPTIVVAELRGALKAAIEYAVKFADGVVADGYIDASDGSDALKTQAAIARAIELWNVLQSGVYAAYPVREASPVTLVAVGGGTMTCDPGQVDAYIEEGWKRA
jgi:hypothetical protein